MTFQCHLTVQPNAALHTLGTFTQRGRSHFLFRYLFTISSRHSELTIFILPQQHTVLSNVCAESVVAERKYIVCQAVANLYGNPNAQRVEHPHPEIMRAG